MNNKKIKIEKNCLYLLIFLNYLFFYLFQFLIFLIYLE